MAGMSANMQTSNGASASYHNNERFTRNHTRVKEACLVRVHMSEVCAVMFICVYVCLQIAIASHPKTTNAAHAITQVPKRHVC